MKIVYENKDAFIYDVVYIDTTRIKQAIIDVKTGYSSSGNGFNPDTYEYTFYFINDDDNKCASVTFVPEAPEEEKLLKDCYCFIQRDGRQYWILFVESEDVEK